MLKKEVLVPLIISIVFSVILFFLQRDSGDIKFAVNNITQLSTGAISYSGFEIFYKNERITNPIYTTHIDIWNNGNLTVRKENILVKYAIENNLQNFKIIKAELVLQSRESINFSLDNLSLSNNKIVFDWDFLQEKDGARILLVFSTTTYNVPQKPDKKIA